MIQIKVSEIMVGDIAQVKYGKKFDFTQLVLSKHDFYELLTPTLSYQTISNDTRDVIYLMLHFKEYILTLISPNPIRKYDMKD